MIQDLHPIGCARLAQAIVIEALYPRYRKTSPSGQKTYGGFIHNAMPSEIRFRAIKLAELSESPLIEHICAVLGWSMTKVRNALAQKSVDWYELADKMEGLTDTL